jgi:hypothetical protein
MQAQTQIFHPRKNTIKHRLKLKEELWKLKYYFTQEKIQSNTGSNSKKNYGNSNISPKKKYNQTQAQTQRRIMETQILFHPSKNRIFKTSSKRNPK